ncbi:MAG: DUF3124 domain-containing protein [Desulfarculus sp.]|nr:DUF3124 domain-containing protein [Desulfarculus sp.]
MTHRIRRATGAIIALLLCACLGAAPALAGELPPKSKGQTVYVPAYTQVYYSARGETFPLVTTLMIHNTDPTADIKLEAVALYDTEGKLLRQQLQAPASLAPFATRDFLAAGLDKAQGLGACFVVTWSAAKPVNPPLLECLMIGTAGQQGISFRSQGQVIAEQGP